MTYRGRVENGVVKLLDRCSLPEGAEVQVRFETSGRKSASLSDLLNSRNPLVEDWPGEFADLAAIVQADRDDDSRLQAERDAKRGRNE